MAQKKKTAPDTQLAQALNQAAGEGIESLTKPQLRRIRNAAIERLKVADKDNTVKRRSIEEYIFPIARSLFPDEIKTPDDVNGSSLAQLFTAKAEDSNINMDPLNLETLDAIKRLAQEWRKNVSHVNYKETKVTISLAGKYGLEYRTANTNRKRIDTFNTWPKLIFPE